MKFTYLIAHAGTEELLDVCKDAINRYTPGNILLATKDRFNQWGDGFLWLFNNCPTEVGVFIDDDCILSDSINDPLEEVINGSAYMAAIDGEGLSRGAGYYQPNLMIININKFKNEFGVKGININQRQYKEETGKDNGDSFLGISQKLRDKVVIPFSALPGIWPLSSDIYNGVNKIATHLWYGAWKHRKHYFINDIDLSVRENDFINHYWNNISKFK